MKEYRVCNRCVMDNVSDDTIFFDENGYCNYCNEAIKNIDKVYFPNKEGKIKLGKIINSIKKDGKGKEYDCLMGLSGGLDSSYLAYLGYKWGLRIIALHIDDGYDTEISKNNINKLCKSAKINLVVIKPDQEQFNDLTRSFILAGVPNIAIPQDNILFAYLYKYARKEKIHNFLSGGNFALECILQRSNTFTAFDVRNTMDIHNRFGIKPINKLPLLSQFRKDMDRYLLKIHTYRPLDLIDYNREKALKELKEFCDFKYYGSKHLENILTKFVQLYYLPKKFNVDKRKSHLSSLIVSGQITRERALEDLKKPLYNHDEMENEIDYLLKCLGMDRLELEKIMNELPKQHSEYKTSIYDKLKAFLIKVKRIIT
jgi:N-acetyl sugar amidotransferase